MKRIALLAITLLFILSADAQQDPQFTQWMFDKLSVNPAYAGTSGKNCLNAFYRDQWDMLERDPKTVMFNYNQRLPQTMSDKIGVGVSFYNDKLGFETNSVFKLSGSYLYELGNADVLSGGVALGYYGKTLGDDWIAKDDPSLDPSINTNEQSAGTFDLGLGIMYTSPGRFYGGISTTHLLGQDMTDLSIDIARHYWLMAGGQIPLGNSSSELRPNLLIKSDGVSLSLDLNAHVMVSDLFWLGASYRLQDAFSPMAGFKYNLNPIQNGNRELHQTLKLGYSYDVTLSDLSNYSAGSHEIMLGYCFYFKFKPVRKPYSNPRLMGREL